MSRFSNLHPNDPDIIAQNESESDQEEIRSDLNRQQIGKFTEEQGGRSIQKQSKFGESEKVSTGIDVRATIPPQTMDGVGFYVNSFTGDKTSTGYTWKVRNFDMDLAIDLVYRDN